MRKLTLVLAIVSLSACSTTKYGFDEIEGKSYVVEETEIKGDAFAAISIGALIGYVLKR